MTGVEMTFKDILHLSSGTILYGVSVTGFGPRHRKTDPVMGKQALPLATTLSPLFIILPFSRLSPAPESPHPLPISALLKWHGHWVIDVVSERVAMVLYLMGRNMLRWCVCC